MKSNLTQLRALILEQKLTILTSIEVQYQATYEPGTTIQPARHECVACCLLRAEKLGFQHDVGNVLGNSVERAASSFSEILRGCS